jgi:hypothetical protein
MPFAQASHPAVARELARVRQCSGMSPDVDLAVVYYYLIVARLEVVDLDLG